MTFQSRAIELTKMGVDGLFKLVQKHAPSAIVPIELTDLAGKTVGIDASLSIYQWYAVGLKHNLDYNHLIQLYKRVNKLRKLGIVPVYVFDGRPPEAKQFVIAHRNATGMRVPTSAHVECFELLRSMGMPAIQAAGEAEATLSKMNALGLIHAVITDDIDVLPFGCKLMIKTLRGKLYQVTTERVLSLLSLTREQFIDLCVMCGSDYTEKTIESVGPASALKLIKKYNTIEQIFANTKLEHDPAFTYQVARAEFINPVVTIVDQEHLMVKEPSDKLAAWVAQYIKTTTPVFTDEA